MRFPSNLFAAMHQSRGAFTSTTRGTTIASSATANVKGSWTNLGAVTDFAYAGFTLYCARNSGASAFVTDVGIGDGSGNYFPIVTDLAQPFAKQANEGNFAMQLPIHVPAGVQLAARTAAAAGLTTSLSCIIIGHSANPGGFPSFSRLLPLFTPANSRGIAIDPGAVTSTKGSWTQLTSSCPAQVEALIGVVGHNGDLARAATGDIEALLDIGIGASGAESIVIPDLCLHWSDVYDGPSDVFFQPIAAHIPTGTRVAARGLCSINTAGDRTFDLALYGLVP